jgi:hypothetical protein
MSRDAEKQADPFAEATPRPWRLSPNGLAVYAQSDPVPAARCYGDSEAEVHANAALIVTAVNERDSLKREVEELREALEQVEAMAVECWDCEGSGIHPRDPESCCDTCGGNTRAWEVPSAALAEIRAALSRGTK